MHKLHFFFKNLPIWAHCPTTAPGGNKKNLKVLCTPQYIYQQLPKVSSLYQKCIPRYNIPI